MSDRRCQGINRSGDPCRAAPLRESQWCSAHDPQGHSGRRKKSDWKRHFLAAYAQAGMVTEACKVAGVGRSTAYRERQADEDFALAWADVEERSTEELEAEATRRAKDGSDVLLIFMLKSRRPEIYRDAPRPAVVKADPPTPEATPEEARRALVELSAVLQQRRDRARGLTPRPVDGTP